MGLVEKQDWPRYRLECVPVASARSDMHAILQPVQPRLITVSPMLVAPREGESGTSSWYTDALSRATSRPISSHYRKLRT
jgi:hypothetical protein